MWFLAAVTRLCLTHDSFHGSGVVLGCTRQLCVVFSLITKQNIRLYACIWLILYFMASHRKCIMVKTFRHLTVLVEYEQAKFQEFG